MASFPSPLVLGPPGRAFVAIDFETADHGPDSACAVGLVRVEGGQVVHRQAVLIRPPRPAVLFTPRPRPHLGGAAGRPAVRRRLAAAGPAAGRGRLPGRPQRPFDRRVLAACCGAAGHPVPAVPFVCTVQLARRRWGQRPNSLPAVCRRLGIPLDHHDAGSDAEACARIVLAATAGERSG